MGFVVLLGTLTAFGALSIDMYLPGFPAIARDLNASGERVQQTLSVFFLGMALGQMFYGPLSDRFGRRPPLLAGLLIYAAASFGCAMAESVAGLIAARFCQALGGCAGMVIVRAVVRDRFDAREAAGMYSRLMLVMGAAPILAPLLGGQLIAWFGWRAIFWTLGAFSLACFAASALWLKESHAPEPGRANLPRTLKTFGAILRDSRFLWPALTVAFSSATLFAYIISSPLVFIEHFGISEAVYPVFFGANAMLFIGAAHLNGLALRRMDPGRILRRAVLALAVFGGALFFCAELGDCGLWATAALLGPLLAALGFVGPNGAAIAMHHQGSHAGSASALLGTVQFAVSAGVGTAVSLAGAWLGSPLRAMCALIAASIGLLAILDFLRRRNERKARPEARAA